MSNFLGNDRELEPQAYSPLINASSAADWHYVAEGGANIVLSYRGANDKLRGKCLRFRKHKASDPPHDSKRRDPSLLFQSHVAKHLLDAEYLPWMIQVELSRTFVTSVKVAVTSQRSEKRKAEGDINEVSGIAVLVEDLVGGDADTVTFEIKPKWGFLPDALAPLDHPTAELKRSFCRTCMLRAVKHNMTGPDRFCPLMLFSDSVAQVQRSFKALYSLWQSSQGAGNNFRIFVGGNLKTSTEGCKLEEGALELLATSLASSKILKTLASRQHDYDPLDIEGLADALAGQPSFSKEPIDLSELETIAAGSSPVEERRKGHAGRWQPRSLLLAYLISATLKDCSILVRTSRGGAGERRVVEAIKVIDLDLKGPDRMPKYVEMDRMLRREFPKRLSQCGGMKSCIELLS